MAGNAHTAVLDTPSLPHSWNTAEPHNNGLADDVSAPSLSTHKALARFEFESGRGNEGTKILMVEWEDDDETGGVKGEWRVSWKNDDKDAAVLPVDDQKANDFRRLYFLIPPGSSVPPSLSMKFVPADETRAPVVWKTTPLPAIFPPELGSFAKEKGKKGVLHTIWAKKRLSVLQHEIESEVVNNPEGIGLEMAMAEKEWIETNFGVLPKQKPSLSVALGDAQGLKTPSISSPRSPGGGRLLEKMKGLRLDMKEDGGAKDESQQHSTSKSSSANPLSPEESDMAMSSFASIKGHSETNPGKVGGPSSVRRMAPQRPPSEIVAQQQSGMGMASLGSVAYAEVSFSRPPQTEQSQQDAAAFDDEEDGLFALPISPRSPETGTSPFSLAK